MSTTSPSLDIRWGEEEWNEKKIVNKREGKKNEQVKDL